MKAETEIVTVDTEQPEVSHFSVNAKIDFLNTELTGVYEHSSSSNKETNVDITRDRICVMPTDAVNGGMLLTEVIAEINTMISSFGGGDSSISSKDVEEMMKQFGLSLFTGIAVELRQAFLYQDNKSVKVNGTEDPKQSAKEMQYAINIIVNNQVKPEDSLKLFHIKSIGLAVWKTNNKKVLDRMNIASIDDLLN